MSSSEFFIDYETCLFLHSNHKFNTDSLLLANFGNVVSKGQCIDLCTGSGIIPALLTKRFPVHFFALDIEQNAINTLEKSIAFSSGKLSRITPICGDLRDENILKSLGREAFSLVTANPPYYKHNSGKSRKMEFSTRTDAICTIEDIAFAACFLLKYGGIVRICMTASRLSETISTFSKKGLEPKKLEIITRKTSGRENEARLFLLECKKGGKSGLITTISKNI